MIYYKQEKRITKCYYNENLSFWDMSYQIQKIKLTNINYTSVKMRWEIIYGPIKETVSNDKWNTINPLIAVGMMGRQEFQSLQFYVSNVNGRNLYLSNRQLNTNDTNLHLLKLAPHLENSNWAAPATINGLINGFCLSNSVP